MKLNLKKRETTGKQVKALRKLNKIPGVIYSRHLKQSINVEFEKIEFLKLYKIAGESTPINLVGDGIKELALIYEIQTDPVTDDLLHVDFLAVKKDEKVVAEIPLVLVGESEVEKSKLGKVDLIKTHVEVEAFPNDLPHNIKIDISLIKSTNDVLFVKDLEVSEKVTILDEENISVVTVTILKDLEEEEESKEENKDGEEDAKSS